MVPAEDPLPLAGLAARLPRPPVPSAHLPLSRGTADPDARSLTFLPSRTGPHRRGYRSTRSSQTATDRAFVDGACHVRLTNHNGVIVAYVAFRVTYPVLSAAGAPLLLALGLGGLSQSRPQVPHLRACPTVPTNDDGKTDSRRGARLAAARKSVPGLSQVGLATRVGVSRQTVLRWETGRSIPQPSHRAPYARELGITTTELARLLGMTPRDVSNETFMAKPLLPGVTDPRGPAESAESAAALRLELGRALVAGLASGDAKLARWERCAAAACRVVGVEWPAISGPEP